MTITEPIADQHGLEHRAIRTTAALIDWSGAALVAVTGSNAATFVGQVTSRNVDFLLEGQSQQALVLTDDGLVVGDVIVHTSEEGYLIVAWPAEAARIREVLSLAAATQEAVTVTDRSTDLTLLGVEGPTSFRLIDPFLDFPVASFAYTATATARYRDSELLISRNGVTGEFGYLVVAPVDLREALIAEFTDGGAVLVGAGAVDTCRMEMRFPNVTGEGGEGASPFELGLQWMVDFHGQGVGRTAALRAATQGHRPVCWEASEGQTEIPAAGTDVSTGGVTIGSVRRACWSPARGRVIGTAALRPDCAAVGLQITIGSAAASTVSAPFLVATSFHTPME